MVHEMIDKVLCDQLCMLTDILEVRVRLLVPYLCFKDGLVGIDPLIRCLCLEGVLFWDIRSTLQAEFYLEVLANQFS